MPISSPTAGLPATRRLSMSLRARLFPMSALAEGDERPPAGATIVAPRADEPVVVVLLDDIGGPAGHAGSGDDRREEIDRNAQRIEERSRVEIDIGDEPLGPLDPVVQGDGHLVPLELPRLAAGVFGHAAENGSPRIAGP